jgi:hemerythrin
MRSITINIDNDTLVDKVTWLLEHVENDDLKLLKATRSEDSIPFGEYVKNGNQDKKEKRFL